jgi:nuclear pore complex protein Nup160
MQDDLDALTAVLPGSQMLASDFDFYVEIAALFQKASETRWEAHFMQLALTVAPRGVDLTHIWQRMVKGYIDLHQWDDAYSGIMSMPIETL